MKQTDFAKALTKYLSDFLPGQRNLSQNTIKSYCQAFKQLLLYMEDNHNMKPEHITLKNMNADTIKNYLHWLENVRNVNINTRNQRLAAIHSFYRYIQSENPEVIFECQRILGIPFKKRKISPIEHLSKENLELLYRQPDVSTKRGRRDLAILVILYDTGARVQELIDLKVNSVRLDNPAIITLNGKGNKSRCVPIMEKTKLILEKYMTESNMLGNGKQTLPLFSNSRNQPFTRPGIQYILNKYFVKAKDANRDVIFPEGIHPHMIRHTKALHLLEAGVNLIYIRDFLGHVSVTTTEVYLRCDTELKRKALESVYMNVVPSDIPNWKEDSNLLTWLQDLCR